MYCIVQCTHRYRQCDNNSESGNIHSINHTNSPSHSTVAHTHTPYQIGGISSVCGIIIKSIFSNALPQLLHIIHFDKITGWRIFQFIFYFIFRVCVWLAYKRFTILGMVLSKKKRQRCVRKRKRIKQNKTTAAKATAAEKE